MRVVYKFEIKIGGVQRLALPNDTKILHVGEQDGRIMLWAQVQNTGKLSDKYRYFRAHGTGHANIEDYETHWATVQMRDGFVWHVYECQTRPEYLEDSKPGESSVFYVPPEVPNV